MTSTISRIRNSVLVALAAFAVAAPAAVADPWGRDYQRGSAPDLVERYVATHPAQLDLLDRYLANDVRSVGHDERFAPIATFMPQPDDGSGIPWTAALTGAALGAVATLGVGISRRRFAHA